jgi:flagellar biosynthesis/type III secretory pathway protein FliH
MTSYGQPELTSRRKEEKEEGKEGERKEGRGEGRKEEGERRERKGKKEGESKGVRKGRKEESMALHFSKDPNPLVKKAL